MKCRHCNEELMDDVIICPACGGDNSQPPKKNWVPVIAIICCVVLVIGVAAAVLWMNRFPDTQTDTITTKACYTEADDTVKDQVNTVVAKAGDFELTNGELQVLYWSMVYDFIDYLGEYAYYYIDFTQPLSGQYYNEEAGITWEHYFLDMALQTWRRYEVLTAEADKAGVTMDETLQSQLDNMYETMESSLESLGFDTVEDMVHHDFGNAATFEDYMAYMDIYYRGNNYYNLMYVEMELTEDEIEAYYTENEEALVSAGYGKEVGNAVDVRHVLIRPNDDTSVTTYTDEEWAACLEKAQGLLDQWKEGEATEETFIQLAVDHSADGNASTGGLYSGITSSTNFVEPFLSWCMDESRQVGDTGLVQSDYGYHIMYFSDSYELWREAAVSNLTSEKMYETMAAMEAEYPMIVAYSRIVLADVPLS